MKKKGIIYGGIGVAVLVLGYFNYFGEEQHIDQLKKVIETSNALYKTGDYIIEAKKQIDYLDDKESRFELAKAKFKELSLEGDNVFLDKMRNLVLKNNIIGKSLNGWELKTSELKYYKDKDAVVTEAGIFVKNAEKGLELSGKKFSSDTKLSHLLLEGDVVLEVETVGIKGQKAEYQDVDKKIRLTGDVTLYNPKKDGRDYRGDFEDLVYDTKTELGETRKPYSLEYDGAKLVASSLDFEVAGEGFSIRDIKSLDKDGYHVTLSAIEKAKNKDEIVFLGPIHGVGEGYDFKADRVVYDRIKEEAVARGKIRIHSAKGEEIEADRAVYKEAEKKLYVYGEGRRASFQDATQRLEGNAFVYDTETGNLSSDAPYEYSNNKGDSFKGRNFVYDKALGRLDITGNIVYKGDGYEAESEDLVYDQKTKVLHFPKAYVLKMEDGTIIRGESGDYDETTGIFKSYGKVSIAGEDYLARGKNLVFNSKEEKGYLPAPVYVKNDKEDMELRGGRLDFAKGKGGTLSGAIKGRLGDTKFESRDANYVEAEEALYLPHVIHFKNAVEGYKGSLEKGVYHLGDKEFVGTKLRGEGKQETISAKEVHYFTETKKAELQGSVRLRKDGSLLESEKASYFVGDKHFFLPGSYVLTKENYRMEAKKTDFNLETKDMKGEAPHMTSTEGDSFKAKFVEGNLDDMIFDFTGGVEGRSFAKNTWTNYSADKAKLFLQKKGKNYEAKEVDLYEHAYLEQDGRKMYGDKGSYDFNTGLATFSGSVRFISEEGQIEADSLQYNMETKKAKAKGNIKMKYDGE